MGSYPLLKDVTGSGGGGGNFVPNAWTGSSTSQFAGTASYVSGSIFTGINPALTASYALTASTVLNPYPINVTGSPYSTLYSVEPPSFQFGNPANTDYSIFFGLNAGYQAGIAGTAKNVVAIGSAAGKSNQTGNINGSNFIGAAAGDSSLFASQSNFIGWNSGYFAYYAYNSNFIGYQAGTYQSYDFPFTNIPNGAYSNYIGYQAGIGYTDTTFFTNRSPGFNNTIIGTNISLPNDTSNYVNLGGAFFISGAYFNTASVNPAFGYSSNILTESINTSKVGINLWNPSYSLHVSGTVAFPNLTDTSQTNVITINTTTGQLFYTASSAIGGGGSGVTINNNTDNYLVTATGTSNTLDGEANLTFDGSSLRVVGDVTASSFTGSFTGSLFGTASYADTASAINVTVSSNTDEFLPVIIAYTGSSDGAKLAYIDNGFQFNPFTNALYLPTNGALVAGNATISSNTSTFGSATAQNHTLNLTGSLNVTKSLNVVGSMSLNVIPTASFHISGTTIINGGNLVGLPFSSFTTVPTQITGNTGIRGFLYVYPRSGDTSSIIFGGGGYQSWTLRSLGFNDFQIRSISNENAIAGPQVTLMHFSSGSNGEFRIGVLNETPEYTFDISGSARVTSSFYLPGLTISPQSNILTVDTATGQVYYTASSEFASINSNTFKGTQIFSGSLLPAEPYVDNTSSYNLGSPTAAWDKIYVSNNSLHFVSGSVSASIGFNSGVINFNNATINIPTGSIIPYTSTSSLIGDGVLSSFNINHGFNTRNLHITVYESGSNGETVYPDIRRINENTASIIFANPPTANQYIVYISQ